MFCEILIKNKNSQQSKNVFVGVCELPHICIIKSGD